MHKIFTLSKLLMSLVFAGAGLLLLSSCNSSSNTSNADLNIEADSEMINGITQAKKIFYSLPSPLETAMLIKTAGATYNEKLLNSLNNVSNYTTNKSMALNLGIYTTDLSFASLFDQTQASIKYMQAAKKMADGLGILDAIDNNTIKRLEDNINNRDAIMDIISETFMASSSYLKENDRTAVASVVLVGGWLEGLYIATQLVDPGNIKDNKLVKRIVDQKLSFDIVVKLLNESKTNPDVASLIVEMNQLQQIFDKIKIKTSENKPVVNNSTNVTTLKSESDIDCSDETFIELTNKVKAIRNNFIL
jgi:hypothetical protein